jgi:predicted PurR-regulated permease PerM
MDIGESPRRPIRPDGPRRSREKVLDRRHGERWRNRLLAAVLALLSLYTFALAKTLVVPVLLAILLSLLLAPAVRRLCRWYMPRAMASFLVLGAVLAVMVLALMAIAGPAQSFLAKAPTGLQRIEHAVHDWRQPIEDVSRRATRSLERLAQLGEPPSVGPAASAPATPGLLSRVMSTMPTAVAGLVIVVFLTFLLLLYGEAILRKMASLMPRFQDRRRLVETTRHTQHQLSSYVLTITLINIGLGLVVAGVLGWMGLDDALLWGGMAAILNFAPYVGAAFGLLLLTLAGFAQFADPGQALLVPAVFLLIQTIEGQLVTPMILGRSMALDPVVVFLAILLLGWLWGVIGMLMAVPLLTCVRLCAEQVRGWYPLARLLGPATPIPPRRMRDRLRTQERKAARGPRSSRTASTDATVSAPHA